MKGNNRQRLNERPQIVHSDEENINNSKILNQQAQMLDSQGRDESGALDGFRAIAQVIGPEQIKQAMQILQKYKNGKKNLEEKIIENEQWYKLRHWETMRKSSNEELKPVSAWLFNCIANKHADAMDNFPSPNILPREKNDKPQAEMLTSIVPVILDQNDYERTYSDTWHYKLKNGTGVYGVYWDKQKHNGLGDVSIVKQDLLNLFWEPGITNIQDSRNLFSVSLVDNEVLVGLYPQLNGKLGTSLIQVKEYIYDDTVDTTQKSAVVDWYYKKMQNGKLVLHYCKFVNDEVLFATENSAEFAENGLYDHGKYPFVFDVLFPIEGTPVGFGYVDVAKDTQMYIDKLNQAILKSALVNARPRYFIRDDGSVNVEEFADLNKDFIHVNGNLGTDSIMPVTTTNLNSLYVNILNNKIEELKETTGNRDVSTGGSGGVTAASGIAAMQEAGSKLSRDANKQSYRAYREMILMVIELIRQFYDVPRCFRILGDNGSEDFVEFSNSGIVNQSQGDLFGADGGFRMPLFDIEVSAQKQSPYSKLSQNELALQLYSAGFFNPQMADQALACLDMMDFDRKSFVINKIQQNGGMYQQLIGMQQIMMQMAAQLEALTGVNPMASMGGGNQQAQTDSTEDMIGRNIPAVSGESESSVTSKARERVANSTSPT